MNSYDILLKSNCIPSGTPISEFNLFIAKCNEYGLNPLRSEAYLLDRYTQGKGRTFFTCIGIGGLRKKAIETGEYEGSPEPLFDGVRLHLYDKKVPNVCTTTVLRGGVAFEYSVLFREYCPEPINQMWEQKPFVMISKVSEAMALRKAFPELNALYIEEELDKLHCKFSMNENHRSKINKKITSGIDSLENKLK